MSVSYTSENSVYLDHNPTWHIEDSAWKAKQVMQMISRNHLHLKTICEIGCGAGEILNQLHAEPALAGVSFFGYDVSPDAFKLAKQREKKGLQFYNADLLNENNNYDLLLMMDVFEHVPDYMSFIKKSASQASLKVFHIPLDMNVLGIMRNAPIRDRKVLGHLHYFSKETALATLEDCGLEIIDFFYTPGIEVDNKTLKQKILNPVRRFFYMFNKDLTVKVLSGYSLLVLA
ncbi:MAG: hypothetical protein JWM28_3042, partial [Chitinophagaceae bacterium]|nr:hypothetical protein [Chitinophagaceae bacterium]